MSFTQKQFKLLTLGESYVGKTSILIQFVDRKFSLNYISTIGVDFKTKPLIVDSNKINLCLWDTAGQERFKHLTKQYYKGADGIMLVYDITQKDTLNQVNNWIKDISSYVLKDEVGLIIVGNKCDLDDQRQVEYKQGEAFANKHGIQFIEVSALKDTNIETAFEMLVRDIIDKRKKKDDSMLGKELDRKCILSLKKNDSDNDREIRERRNCSC